LLPVAAVALPLLAVPAFLRGVSITPPATGPPLAAVPLRARREPRAHHPTPDKTRDRPAPPAAQAMPFCQDIQ
jgi:hypothetical protein